MKTDEMLHVCRRHVRVNHTDSFGNSNKLGRRLQNARIKTLQCRIILHLGGFRDILVKIKGKRMRAHHWAGAG